MVAVPVVSPNTRPESEVIMATVGEPKGGGDIVHVPPPTISVTYLFEPTHTLSVPAISASGFIVIAQLTVQPHASV